MRRLICIPVLFTFACKDAADDSALEPPTLSILSPEADATVVAGDVAVSLVVEHFVLVEPVASRDSRSDRAFGALMDLMIPGGSAAAHTEEGTPEGYISLSLDGTEVLTTGSTQATISVTDAADHTLEAQLFYTDGDELEPPVTASVSFSAVAP